MDSEKNEPWVNAAKLAEHFSVSQVTIWRWAKEGIIPKPRNLSPGTSRWKISDVENALCANREGSE